MSRTSGGTVIINGIPTAVLGYSGNNRKTIESSLYSRGFMVYPKDLSTNISVENIQKHPELFERFIYLPIFGENIIDTINNNLDFIDGKLMNKEKMDDGTYEYFDMADKDKEYLESFYPNELKEFLDKINSLKRPKYKFEEVEVIAAGGKDSFKRIIGGQSTDNSVIVKPVKSEKEPKRNTTVKQSSAKENGTKIETYIELFNDLMKSITPEQLNMKINIAGNGEPPKEVAVSDFMNQINGFISTLENMGENAKSGTLIEAPMEKTHTAKDIDFNNPDELVQIDEINYTHIAEALD